MAPEVDGHGPSTSHSGDKIGLVLSGGGARGAYEAGVLSVLLPALRDAGQDVSIIIGTSVGALNGMWLAANAHRRVHEIVDRHFEMWRELRWEDVLAPIFSIASAVPLMRYIAGMMGARVEVESLLDSRPLAATVERRLDFSQLAANVAAGRPRVAAVVATSAQTGRSVVFHSGGPHPRRDDGRGIDYVPVVMESAHVRASAAIPAVFRPVYVPAPAKVAGWYVDGGTRLNTPIKPALAFGADRVIVIALNTTRRTPGNHHAAACPDIFSGVGHLTQAVLADPLVHDIRTLAAINEAASSGGRRMIPYMLIEPTERDRIGAIARRVAADHYNRFGALRGSVGALSQVFRAAEHRANGELLSYLFFAPEFTDALLAEGASDARRWLEGVHDDGIWQHGPIDYSARRAPARRRSEPVAR